MAPFFVGTNPFLVYMAEHTAACLLKREPSGVELLLGILGVENLFPGDTWGGSRVPPALSNVPNKVERVQLCNMVGFDYYGSI